MFMTRYCIYVVFLVHISNVCLAIGTGCPSPNLILPCRCLMKAEEYQVWCSHSDLPKVLYGLRTLAQLIQSPIDELILENNYLPSLPGRTFSTLRILRLMVRQNGLERVSHDWLFGLEGVLMELFIVEPRLRYLPDESLSRLNSLEAITIQTNELKRLPQVTDLAKLRYLQIESQELAGLSSANFKKLPLLEKFHISRSGNLKRLEAGLFEELAALKSINISLCGINWLHPRTFFNLPMMRELSLVGNKIQNVGMIGRSSKDLISLKTIYLDFNEIDRLSEGSFVDIPSLESLHLSHNTITEIHQGAFHKVPNLRILNLNHNALRRVHPESFLQSSDSGVEELWMSYNDISHTSELKSLLDALPRLVFLDMSYNNLEIITFGSLRGHPTLEILKLNHNKIYQIDKESFMAMPALRELGLKNNSLTNFNQEPLWNLPSLKGLDISYNYYKRLEPLFLMNLPSLRRLDVNNNKLVTIDPITFSVTPLIESINISNNDLQFIHPSTLKHLHNLYELDISHNQLEEFLVDIPKELEHLHLKFNKLRMIPLIRGTKEFFSLKYLDVSHNFIDKINQYSLKGFPFLKRLYIKHNLLRRLEDEIFHNLSKLEILDIYGNKLTHVHPNAFENNHNLIELNLGDNNLENILPAFLQKIPKLMKLDVSYNKLVDFVPGNLNYQIRLKYLNISHNFLVKMPQNISKMKYLKYLDMSYNRIKFLTTGIFSNLKELVDLRLSNNYIKELKEDTFTNLQKVKFLHLDHNDIDTIETNSFQSLVALEVVTLGSNSLSKIPSYAFNNLPELQIIELQNNLLDTVSNNAFNLVPSLLVLNLSNNHIITVEDAGFRSLPSLEVLDLSNNLIEKIESDSFRKMKWLVEIRIDGNNICGIFGTPFSSMPRLRVISLKRNKLITVSESVLDKIRTNVAIFNVDDNPLECDCSVAWLQAWAEESSVVGPSCSDGNLLREIKFSPSDCERKEIENFSNQCGAQNPQHLTSQVFSKHTSFSNTSGSERTNNLPPLPQESEYFYDEYVDYHFNDSLPVVTTYEKGNILDRFLSVNHSSLLVPRPSPHIVSGDTPTLYAATSGKITKPDIPKEVLHSPSSSGFTFFGVPLPSINFNNIFGKNRNSSIPTAERKIAILNNPPALRTTSFRYPPNFPLVESGGFVPMLPGEGGFQPIFNPTTTEITQKNTEYYTESSVATTISKSVPQSIMKKIQLNETDLKNSASSDFLQNSSRITTTNPKYISSTVKPTEPTVKSNTVQVTQKTQLETTTLVEEVTSYTLENTSIKSSNITTYQTENLKDVTETTTESGEIVKKDLHGRNQSNIVTSTEESLGQINRTKSFTLVDTSEVTTRKIDNNTITSKNITNTSSGNKKLEQPSPLSSLLVPGGQQPYIRPAGRSKITKVQSPYTTEASVTLVGERKVNEFSGIGSERVTLDPEITKPNGVGDNWYFANYNKSNSEPFHGVLVNGGCNTGSLWVKVSIFLFLLGIV
ncbi:hypothetical protein WA026_000984 [Henosepilachna vigintioctopunctata]|uniref:Chaoptin n=1 Tax=Henosepilachna vigintioctopunctata TaxID=420089 RepID=A0AAW1V6P4_9CUCU